MELLNVVYMQPFSDMINIYIGMRNACGIPFIFGHTNRAYLLRNHQKENSAR